MNARVAIFPVHYKGNRINLTLFYQFININYNVIIYWGRTNFVISIVTIKLIII